MSERNELERLQHDIERHVAIAAEQATELARLRAEVERLTDERTRATAALREAFGEELWRLGHPAYVVVHLREEFEKAMHLWKSACTERDALLARVEAWERAAQGEHPSPCTLGPLCPYCEIVRLQARVAAAEQDAARYRHWRNLSGPVPHCFIRLSGAELDAAIDAAQKEGM